jgi:hypothetical protein
MKNYSLDESAWRWCSRCDRTPEPFDFVALRRGCGHPHKAIGRTEILNRNFNSIGQNKSRDSVDLFLRPNDYYESHRGDFVKQKKMSNWSRCGRLHGGSSWWPVDNRSEASRVERQMLAAPVRPKSLNANCAEWTYCPVQPVHYKSAALHNIVLWSAGIRRNVLS